MSPAAKVAKTGRPQRRRPEYDHERGVICPLYGGLGFEVWPTSARNHVIGIKPGMADLYVLASARLGVAFWHETKVGKERQSFDQRRFQLEVEACGVPYVLGDVESANDFLVHMGLAERVRITVRFRERSAWPDASLCARLAVSWSRSVAHGEQQERWGYRPAAGGGRHAPQSVSTASG